MASTRGVRFEVIGKVQGVFFRKYTKKTCDKHGVTGWVLNTKHGSVQGYMEGTHSAVDSVKVWLQTKGSPKSRIDRCSFYEEKEVSKSHSRFSIITNDSEVSRKTFKT